MLEQLTLSNLTVFPEANFCFSPYLNVVMGENGAGKTHVLKGIYSALAVSAEGGGKPNASLPTSQCSRLAWRKVSMSCMSLTIYAADEARQNSSTAQGATHSIYAQEFTRKHQGRKNKPIFLPTALGASG